MLAKQEHQFLVLLASLRESKKQHIDTLARAYAVTITMLEQAYAYFDLFVVQIEEEADGKEEELDRQSD